jgi:hypothetical protein
MAQPGHANPVADAWLGDCRSDLLDDPDDFVAGYHRGIHEW